MKNPNPSFCEAENDLVRRSSRRDEVSAVNLFLLASEVALDEEGTLKMALTAAVAMVEEMELRREEEEAVVAVAD